MMVREVFATVAVTTLLFSKSDCLADSLPNVKPDGHMFWSASNKSAAVLGDDGSQLKVIQHGKTLYEIKSSSVNFSHGDVHVSDNGSFLVWNLSNYFLGHLSSDPEFRKPELQTTALLFYKNGKPLRAYDIRTLLVRDTLVLESSIHTKWLPSMRRVNGAVLRNPELSLNGKKFYLVTTSFREYAFNTETGKMLNSGDTRVWKESSFIGCVRLSPANEGMYIEPLSAIKGSMRQVRQAIVRDPAHLYDSGIHPISLKFRGKFAIPTAVESEIDWVCSIEDK